MWLLLRWYLGSRVIPRIMCVSISWCPLSHLYSSSCLFAGGVQWRIVPVALQHSYLPALLLTEAFLQSAGQFSVTNVGCLLERTWPSVWYGNESELVIYAVHETEALFLIHGKRVTNNLLAVSSAGSGSSRDHLPAPTLHQDFMMCLKKKKKL